MKRRGMSVSVSVCSKVNSIQYPALVLFQSLDQTYNVRSCFLSAQKYCRCCYVLRVFWPKFLNIRCLELSLSFSQNLRQSFFQNVRISPYGVSGALSFFLSNFPAIFLLKAGDGGTMSLPVQIPLWIEACSESVLTKIKAPMSGRQKSAALFSLKRSSCHSSKISPL